MPKLLQLAQLREIVQTTIEDLASWFVAKPRVFELTRPEQQIQFELAFRLRETIRQRTENPTWDRLYYDASDPGPTAFALATVRAPIFVDSRQLFGTLSSAQRSAAEPDVALAVHVLRTTKSSVDFDENGGPLRQSFLPTNLLSEAVLLEQRVAQLERLAYALCDGALLVVYSNEARRRTAVEAREVASWASWQTPLDTVWWTVRHFRAKAR